MGVFKLVIFGTKKKIYFFNNWHVGRLRALACLLSRCIRFSYNERFALIGRKFLINFQKSDSLIPHPKAYLIYCHVFFRRLTLKKYKNNNFGKFYLIHGRELSN